MAVNKVVYGITVLIDISDSTVTPETLTKGVVAYNAKGERIVGTHKFMNQDLTGTIWLFNSPFKNVNFPYSATTILALNFEDETGNSYVKIRIMSSGEVIRYYDAANKAVVVTGNTGNWIDEKYRKIKITGGEAATDTAFISWLQDNAVYQGVAL